MENGAKSEEYDANYDLEEEIDEIVYALADFKGLGKDQVNLHPNKMWRGRLVSCASISFHRMLSIIYL